MLCYGITPDDHDWLQTNRGDVEACAAYLHDHEITAALAHPFYAVAAPLTARHRRRLAELFPIWETRNGSRAKELNLPAFVYIETHGGTAIGGSDDHAGIDIGRTFTETPRARTPQEFLAHVRAGRASAHGQQGSAAKWAHAAMALAIRSLGDGDAPSRPDPVSVLKIVERVMCEGDARHGNGTADLEAGDALALLRAWLLAMDLDVDEHKLLYQLQEGELGHADLDRRARRVHERKLATVVHDTVAESRGGPTRRRPQRARAVRRLYPGNPLRGGIGLPRPREGEARADRRRSAACGARRRRHRVDARGHPHAPADPRPRQSAASMSR